MSPIDWTKILGISAPLCKRRLCRHHSRVFLMSKKRKFFLSIALSYFVCLSYNCYDVKSNENKRVDFTTMRDLEKTTLKLNTFPLTFICQTYYDKRPGRNRLCLSYKYVRKVKRTAFLLLYKVQSISYYKGGSRHKICCKVSF